MNSDGNAEELKITASCIGIKREATKMHIILSILSWNYEEDKGKEESEEEEEEEEEDKKEETIQFPMDKITEDLTSPFLEHDIVVLQQENSDYKIIRVEESRYHRDVKTLNRKCMTERLIRTKFFASKTGVTNWLSRVRGTMTVDQLKDLSTLGIVKDFVFRRVFFPLPEYGRIRRLFGNAFSHFTASAIRQAYRDLIAKKEDFWKMPALLTEEGLIDAGWDAASAAAVVAANQAHNRYLFEVTHRKHTRVIMEAFDNAAARLMEGTYEVEYITAAGKQCCAITSVEDAEAERVVLRMSKATFVVCRGNGGITEEEEALSIALSLVREELSPLFVFGDSPADGASATTAIRRCGYDFAHYSALPVGLVGTRTAVIVDYAHTLDMVAMAKLATSVERLGSEAVILVGNPEILPEGRGDPFRSLSRNMPAHRLRVTEGAQNPPYTGIILDDGAKVTSPPSKVPLAVRHLDMFEAKKHIQGDRLLRHRYNIVSIDEVCRRKREYVALWLSKYVTTNDVFRVSSVCTRALLTLSVCNMKLSSSWNRLFEERRITGLSDLLRFESILREIR